MLPSVQPTMTRLEELARKVDAFFDAVRGRRPGSFACGPGCHDCCAPGLEVTLVEAEWIRTRPPAPRGTRADRCAALGDDGRCGIYEVRPLVCRSHGLPIRFAREGRRLPVIDACPKNFLEGLEGLPPGDVLDQTTLSTVLGAIDLVHARAVGAEPGERVPIAALLQGR